jgi:prophage antirepressor-like protein
MRGALDTLPATGEDSRKECDDSEASGIRTRQSCGFFAPCFNGRECAGTKGRKAKEARRLASVITLPPASRRCVMTAPRGLSRLSKEYVMTSPATGAFAPAVFNFQSLDVRAFADDAGEPWFCAADVCAVLGYRNSRRSIDLHCRDQGVTKRYTPTKSGNQEMTFINEGNLYRLIVKSRNPEAQAFEQEVMEVILPAIRKTGRYDALQARLDAPVPSFARRRWLLVVDPHGGEMARPLDPEHFLTKINELPGMLRDPAFDINGNQLAEIIRAGADRMASELSLEKR